MQDFRRYNAGFAEGACRISGRYNAGFPGGGGSVTAMPHLFSRDRVPQSFAKIVGVLTAELDE